MRRDLQRRATGGGRTHAPRPFLGLLAVLSSAACAADPPADRAGDGGATAAGEASIDAREAASAGARALDRLARIRGEAVVAASPRGVEVRSRSGGLHLRDPRSRVGAAVRVEGAREVAAEVIAGATVHPGAGPGGADLVIVPAPDGAEDWVVLPSRPARDAVRYEVALENVAGLRLVSGVLELLDASGAPRLRARPPYLVDARGERHAARFEIADCDVDTSAAAPWGRPPRAPGRETCRVDVAWDAGAVAYPAALDPVWEATNSGMAKGRRWHTATPLGADTSSPVLLAGGFDGAAATSLAELYQPLSRTFAATGSLATARGAHAAVALNDGTVLIAGGAASVASSSTGDDTSGELASMERYSPATGAFSPAGVSLAQARANLTATLIAGKVLLAGGQDPLGQPKSSTEIFDPAGPSIAAGPAMSFARAAHTATAIDGSRVLVVGGFAAVDANSLQNTEIYNALSGANGAFTAGPSSVYSRAYHTATKLDDGRILLAGGISKPNDPANAKIHETTQLYTPNAGTGTLADGPSMSKERAYHAAAKLQTGIVVISGGFGGDPAMGAAHAPHASADLLDPVAGTITAGPDMASPRLFHTLVSVNPAGSLVDGAALPAAGALAAGGVDVQGSSAAGLSSAELLLRPLGEACATGLQCATGHCSDGVCCDQACDGECDSCAMGLKDSGTASGTCEPSKKGVAVGNQLVEGPDLGTQCISNSVSYFTCDGSGAKTAYFTEDCKGNPCAADGKTCIDTCDGVTAKCLNDSWCDLAVGKCEKKRSLGVACDSGEQCVNVNGNENDGFCIDGVCCNTECAETCNACNVTGFVGTCTHAGTNGAQPPVGQRACSNPTTAGDEPCAGYCDVQVSPSPLDCVYPGATVLCGAEKTCACADSGDCVVGPTTQARFACDGTGACEQSDVQDDGATPYVTDCGGHFCAPPADNGHQQCATVCATDGDCLEDFFCDGASCAPLPDSGRCDGKHTLRVPGQEDVDCAPYLCPEAETACRSACTSDLECVADGSDSDPENQRVCNNSGECVAPPSAPVLPSCSAAPASPAHGAGVAAAALGLLLGGLARRRRRS